LSDDFHFRPSAQWLDTDKTLLHTCTYTLTHAFIVFILYGHNCENTHLLTNGTKSSIYIKIRGGNLVCNEDVNVISSLGESPII